MKSSLIWKLSLRRCYNGNWASSRNRRVLVIIANTPMMHRLNWRYRRKAWLTRELSIPTTMRWLSLWYAFLKITWQRKGNWQPAIQAEKGSRACRLKKAGPISAWREWVRMIGVGFTDSPYAYKRQSWSQFRVIYKWPANHRTFTLWMRTK